MSARILIVDDDPYIRLSLGDRLRRTEYRIFEAESCSKTRELIKKHELDLILLDLQLPDGDGLELLDEVSQSGESLEVIVITAHGSIEKAVEAMRRGAQDFLQKPFELTDMEARIRRALDHRRLKRDTDSVQAGRTEEIARSRIAGQSKQMKECLEQCRRLSQTDTTVLITGETGTGKEVLAQRIHATSRRADRPFVAVSCANFSEHLIDDELFGHEIGAFTGATRVRRGKIELADGGTLFLDEIGELPCELQSKLLRFLEGRTYTRLGGEKEREADVRVITATNRNLQAEIKKGNFREDLFYRLNVYSINIPPLRDRKKDIPELINHFLQQMTGKQSPRFTISPEAHELLMKYHWPGNVRELRNVIERAIVIASDAQITIDEILPLDVSYSAPASSPESYQRQLIESQKKILLAALRECGGNRTEAAKKLQLHRTDLLRKIRNLGLQNDPVLQNRSEDQN